MKISITSLIAYCLVAIIILIVIIPVIWTVLNSFKYFRDIVTSNIFSSEWTPRNYEIVLLSRDENIIRQLVNSVIYVIITLFIVIPMSTFAGYGLARLPHRSLYKILALNSLVFSRIVPGTSIALPFFVLFRIMNIYDTYVALVIVYVLRAVPLAVFMIMTFIEEIPIEIEESASIDGANTLSIMTRMVVPLILPGMAATAIFIFIYTWNDYLFAAFLTGKNAANLQIAIGTFNTEYFVRWGELCAAIVIAIAPIVVFTIMTQKYIVRGLTMGAIKG